ncbi:MAG: hypothetical protein U1F77_13050 [Kiritimatiellia bacterium]
MPLVLARVDAVKQARLKSTCRRPRESSPQVLPFSARTGNPKLNTSPSFNFV